MVNDTDIFERLNRAAESGGSLAMMFREQSKHSRLSLDALRVTIHPTDDALLLDIQHASSRVKKMAAQISYTQLYQSERQRRLPN